MNLVFSLISVVLVSVLLSFVGREAWAWLPRLSRVIIVLGTALLPAERRQLRREEWMAELAARTDDRRLSGLLWALALCAISLWERTSALHSGVGVIASRTDEDHATAVVNTDTSPHGVWAEIWTSNMQRTPYKVFVCDEADADRELDLLSERLGQPREEWTIKPPRGWAQYGMPRPHGPQDHLT